MIKVWLFQQNGGKVVDTKNTLEDYYKLIGCDTIEVVRARVGDTYFDIICDEEGLLKEKNYVSAVDKYGRAVLVGNLVFCHTDDGGEFIGISEDDVAELEANVIELETLSKAGAEKYIIIHR